MWLNKLRSRGKKAMTRSSSHIKLYLRLKTKRMTIGINLVILTRVVNDLRFVEY